MLRGSSQWPSYGPAESRVIKHRRRFHFFPFDPFRRSRSTIRRCGTQATTTARKLSCNNWYRSFQTPHSDPIFAKAFTISSHVFISTQYLYFHCASCDSVKFNFSTLRGLQFSANRLAFSLPFPSKSLRSSRIEILQNASKISHIFAWNFRGSTPNTGDDAVTGFHLYVHWPKTCRAQNSRYDFHSLSSKIVEMPSFVCSQNIEKIPTM